MKPPKVEPERQPGSFSAMGSYQALNVGLILACILGLTLPLPIMAQDLRVLERWHAFSDAKNFFHHHLNHLALQHLQQRERAIEKLKTRQDWMERQTRVKSVLEQLTDFPEKTPLEVQITGVIDSDDYTCEKLVFQARPNFFVPGALFIPRNLEKPVPGILFLSGHSFDSFRSPHYQQVILNLVKKDFVVLAIDPIGQGEFLQYYDDFVGKSRFPQPTGEHSYLANQSFLTGSSAYSYFIWNAVRAIDLLSQRPEVDSGRLGVTGLSGGGFQTAQVSALDERVAAAAPAAYITSWRRLLEWRGPGDGEQNLNGGLQHGIDYADLLEVRAPRPTLVVATTQDFVPFQGTLESFQEAKAAFRALGHPENLQMVEDDHGHGYTRKTREAIYAFFQSALNHPGEAAEEKVEFLSLAELQVTPTGQVRSSFGSETVFTLNRQRALAQAEALEESRQDLETHLSSIPRVSARISGYQAPSEPPEALFRGRLQQDNYQVEKWVIGGEGKTIIPLLLMLPELRARAPVVLYLDPEGKAAEAGPGGEIQWFLKRGFAVAAADLAGTGELGPLTGGEAYLGVQLGRSIPAFRAAETVRILDFLQTREEVDGNRILAVARGELCPALLHASVQDERISQVALMEPVASYRLMAVNRFYQSDFSGWVANSLTAYDLPDLAAVLAPRPLLLVNVLDQVGQPASEELIETELEVVERSYRQASAAEHLLIRVRHPWMETGQIFSEWTEMSVEKPESVASGD